jgi:hypothetical protein
MSKRNWQAKRSVPWWLAGDEQCPHCQQLYAYELEIRCVECDEPGCPHCMQQQLERGIVCVVCSAGCEAAGEAARG